jgi:asparagine synthase (glutamine-hydrolysing)
MCGITGKLYFNNKRSVQINELKKMTDFIRYRGPDDEGYYLDNNIGLGFRRLSIIDIAGGHQPLIDSTGRYIITFNGEIYNYQEERVKLIKKGYIFKTGSDTEVILNLYTEYKEKCLEYLRGMFAFVIWDKKEKILFGARDRFGIKPFHYYIDDEKFIWGSEIKSIISQEGVDKKISISSLDYYLAYGYTPIDNSIFEKIKKIPPANYFIIKNVSKEIVLKPYWDIKFEPDYSKTENHWKEELFFELEKSIKLRMISDVPLGAFLSGGIDSSSVVSLMAKNSNYPVQTFTIGFNEEKYSEVSYAKELAYKYNTNHHELIVTADSVSVLPKIVSSHDEPFADSSSIPTYYVSKFAREYVTVVLSGDGGDELFAGYDSYPKMQSLYNFPIRNNTLRSLIFGTINKILPDYFYGKGYSYFLSKNKDNLAAYFNIWKDYERRKLYNSKESILNIQAEERKIAMFDQNVSDFLSKMQKLDMQTYMMDGVLTKVDRASMMNSLEVRVPILDHKLAELSFTIPSELKLNRNIQKWIFKEAVKDLLPKSILDHKKQGFTTPLDDWFKKDLRDYANEILLNKSARLYDYVNYTYVVNLLNNHQKGMRSFSSKIWSLLVLEEWFQQNVNLKV